MVTHSGLRRWWIPLGRREYVACGDAWRARSAGPRILTAGIPLFPAHALPYYLAELPAELKARWRSRRRLQMQRKLSIRNRAAGYDIVKLFTVRSWVRSHSSQCKWRSRVQRSLRHIAMGSCLSHTTNLEGTKVAIDAGVDVLAHNRRLQVESMRLCCGA